MILTVLVCFYCVSLLGLGAYLLLHTEEPDPHLAVVQTAAAMLILPYLIIAFISFELFDLIRGDVNHDE